MLLISHRGELNGSDTNIANLPEQVDKVLSLGYECEIDVWKISSNFFLGHDSPQYKVDEHFLQKKGLWCHAKNLSALDSMLDHNIHCFWHEADKFTVTSQGYIWTFPNGETTSKSIVVANNQSWKNKKFQPLQPWGVCTSYIQ